MHIQPLKSGEYFNAVIEIPKYTKAKMEISTKEESNPIGLMIFDIRYHIMHSSEFNISSKY